MNKSDFTMLFSWSAEYVIAHAKWQKSRGRRPSMAYRGVRNPEKALKLAIAMSEDVQFKDVIVKEVNKHSFTQVDGWSFGIRKEWSVSIKVGDVARFYGKGIGSVVRGLDINGVQCYYRTKKQQAEENARWIAQRKAEQKAEFEKNKASLDEKYRCLPEVFQRRIDKFRANNPDFRWKYESYEIFCCEQANLIATAISDNLMKEVAKEYFLSEARHIIAHSKCRAKRGRRPSLAYCGERNPAKATKMLQDAQFTNKVVASIRYSEVQGISKKQISENIPSAIEKFAQIPFEKQKEIVPGISDDHSGNTFGCSLKLASLYVSKHSENVVKLHGALAPLVGSEEYGCVAKAS
jgi:hypothetical protein